MSSAPLLLVLFCGVALAARQNLPSYVKTCSRNDPKLSECALKQGKEIIPRLIKGDPSIRLPVLDPLVLDKVSIKTAGRANGGGLQLTCYKCNVNGLSSAVLKDIKIDLAKKHIDLKIFIPQLSVTGKYDVDGKLLLFPINGKGLANLTLSDLDAEAGLDWKLIKRKGSEYAHISRDKVDIKASRFRINLTGLFNGDKTLGDNMNQLLNENWKDVLNDLRPSISGTVGEIIKFTLNNVFDTIPYELFFPEKYHPTMLNPNTADVTRFSRTEINSPSPLWLKKVKGVMKEPLVDESTLPTLAWCS